MWLKQIIVSITRKTAKGRIAHLRTTIVVTQLRACPQQLTISSSLTDRTEQLRSQCARQRCLMSLQTYCDCSADVVHTPRHQEQIMWHTGVLTLGLPPKFRKAASLQDRRNLHQVRKFSPSSTGWKALTIVNDARKSGYSGSDQIDTGLQTGVPTERKQTPPQTSSSLHFA